MYYVEMHPSRQLNRFPSPLHSLHVHPASEVDIARQENKVIDVSEAGKEIESITQSKVWKGRSSSHGWNARDAAMSFRFWMLFEQRDQFFHFIPWDRTDRTNIAKSRLCEIIIFLNVSSLMNESELTNKIFRLKQTFMMKLCFLFVHGFC